MSACDTNICIILHQRATSGDVTMVRIVFASEVKKAHMVVSYVDVPRKTTG